MARGDIQFIPTRNRFAELQQGSLNLVSGLNQQFQQRSMAQELATLAQQVQSGGAIDFGAFKNPQVQQLALQTMLQQQQRGRPIPATPGTQLLDPFTGQAVGQGIPPAAPSATQGIAQQKLNRINQLQAIPVDERTDAESESLKRLIEGQSAVQINFPQPAAASERMAIAETNASLDALNNLETLFNKSTTVTGPIAGRVERAKGFFGLSSVDQENLLAATSAFKNKVIKDITGAQMSEQEASRIMKQIPLETDPPIRWRAKKKQTEQNLRIIQRRRIQVLQESGLLAPGINVPALQSGQQPGPQQLPEDPLAAIDREIAELEAQIAGQQPITQQAPVPQPIPEGLDAVTGAERPAIVAMEKNGVTQRVGLGAIKQLLDQGFKFPANSNIQVVHNTSNKPRKLKGKTIGPGQRLISFDGGRTWQLLR